MVRDTERETWDLESFQRTFTRHSTPQRISREDRIGIDAAEYRAARMNMKEEREGTNISPEQIAKADKIDLERAEYRAVKMRLSKRNAGTDVKDTTETEREEEIISIEHEKVVPFSSITFEMSKSGFIEQIVRDGDKTTKRISFTLSSDQFTQFSIDTEKISEDKDIDIRIITIEEIASGHFELPMDAWNLGNFNEPHYRNQGDFRNSFLNVAHRVYENLHNEDERMKRSNVCISKAEKQIILLPFTNPNDN